MADETRRKEYEVSTVAQLKALLEQRGLPKSGNKSKLVERLLEADAAAEALKKAAESETVEVVEPEAAPKTCRGCSAELPEGWKFPYCEKCHEGWQRQKRAETSQAVEKALTQVHGILSGIIERNPWYDFAGAISLFEEAKAKYAARDYRGLIGSLYQGVLGEANRITAEGDLGYIGRLLTAGEFEETDELRELRESAEQHFAQQRFREAAERAREAKRLAGTLRRKQGEVKREELLESLTFEPQSQRRQRQAKKG